MRATFFLASWLGLSAVLNGAELAPRVAPKFTRDTLPVPPQQKADWSAGLGIVPVPWIDAARTLFEQGLADPRGCEYREIEVVAGSISGGGYVVPTHGWVLPRVPPAQQDFAVCWNGLVYPVVRVGAPADFHAEFREEIGPPDPSRRFASGEATRLTSRVGKNVVGSPNLPLQACLLLRLGEPALAREITLQSKHRESERWSEKTGERAIDENEDPYLEWARQWAWSLWDRAVCAHMRGDDGLALTSLRQLAGVNVAIRQEAGRRGFKNETAYDDSERIGAWRFLDWLRKPFPLLLADQERRAQEPRRLPVIASGLEKFPDKPSRIAGLVEDLQEVAVTQMSQPGGLEPFIEDPTAAALVAEGADAVEPLLQAWERDGGRLTRSVSFGRDFAPGRTLHTVAEPAAAILAAIMQVSIDDLRALPGGTTPATVRAYWKKVRGTTPMERWYRTMADDTAGAKAWQQAAKEIVRPNNVRNLGNGRTTWTPLKSGEVAPMAGEPLRAKTDPTLSELWQKRAAQMRPDDEHVRAHVFDLTSACAFVANLARWDRTAAVKEAALHMALCRRHVEGNWGMMVSPGESFVDFLSRFALVRADSGDLAGLEEYCAWLASAKSTPESEPFHPNHWMGWEARERMRLFEPLWRYAQNPTVRAAVLSFSPDRILRPVRS